MTSSSEPTIFRSSFAPSSGWAFDAAIFDLDGVMTGPADVHSRMTLRLWVLSEEAAA